MKLIPSLRLSTLTVISLLLLNSLYAIAPGQAAPDFTLPDPAGQKHSLSDYRGKYVVLEWTNPGCPFVVKFYKPGVMQKWQKEWTGKGVVWLTINSTNPDHQDYLNAVRAAAHLKETGAMPTAMLLDPEGQAGRLYEAKTTPHCFVIDPSGMIIYAGAIDDQRSTNSADIAKAVNYVAQALTEAMSGKPVSVPVTKPYGCSVKYK